DAFRPIASNGETLRCVSQAAPRATCVQALPPLQETVHDDAETQPSFRAPSIRLARVRRRPASPAMSTLRYPAFRQAETTSDKSAHYRDILPGPRQGGCALRRSETERLPARQRTRVACRARLRSAPINLRRFQRALKNGDRGTRQRQSPGPETQRRK